MKRAWLLFAAVAGYAAMSSIPGLAFTSQSYSWPGVSLTANPGGTYSAVYVSGPSASCPRSPAESYGFDGKGLYPMYSCSRGVYSAHPRFVSDLPVGDHTLDIGTRGVTTSYHFTIH
jgi:hypothetical protein